jgi:hypothetical protein
MQQDNNTEESGKVIEIASDGDVILVVGSEARIRVSSRSLIRTSKPFSAMFSPEWKEGRKSLSQDELVDVHLPEDDPEALKLICAVMHHRNEAVPRNLSAVEVFRVAVAADKYDCVSVLKFVSETWLWLREMNAQDMAFLTTAAYILRNAEAFRELTKALVLSYDGPYIALCSEQMESAMTWRVFCKYFENQSDHTSTHAANT